MPLPPFCVGHLLVGMGPALQSVFIPSKTLLKRNIFSFVSAYQLERVLGLGMGSYVHFSQFGHPILRGFLQPL